jgi:hypothetical protein
MMADEAGNLPKTGGGQGDDDNVPRVYARSEVIQTCDSILVAGAGVDVTENCFADTSFVPETDPLSRTSRQLRVCGEGGLSGRCP